MGYGQQSGTDCAKRFSLASVEEFRNCSRDSLNVELRNSVIKLDILARFWRDEFDSNYWRE